MSDAVLFIDDDDYRCCRICHDQDLESCKTLESPCHCSGTLKFAHRDCIQRWCNEKGNTTCEICLQKFKHGYTAAKKPKLIQTTPTIRGSLVIATTELETEPSEEILEPNCTRFTSPVDVSAGCCRSMALIFTILLLVKNLFAILTGGAHGYPFSLLTVLVVKATGIIVPMYVLIRITAGIHNSINHQHYQVITAQIHPPAFVFQNPDSNVQSSSNEGGEDEDDEHIHIDENDNNA
ncbi:hypothetical protein C2S53_017137 [Perilla frutescens var. hirtella]|uniref:RING-CH-type domain-containing protein n=1 Tax=Perilla frutescens var. hirtella TaxID=608512 RepID=A0AAD4J3P6_PERFH|nr:hypothetical protein C2S53_017137 [Perilla frutescens var. hirtella]